MSGNEYLLALQKLENRLLTLGKCTVAVSGGIDSMLMAFIAHQILGHNALIAHATSPAVPRADGCRVQDYAQRYQWNFTQVTTGEINSENYQQNPVNRCYYCKSSLYLNLRQLDHGQVITGTNLDDLADYRPGLLAAKEQHIVHPYIDSQIDKATIRKIAQHLELRDLQDLPASPCLASRIETGIRIVPSQLDLIDRAESYVRKHIASETVRLRIRHSNMVLELDDQVLHNLTSQQSASLRHDIELMAKESGLTAALQLAAYVRGSAFVGHKNSASHAHE